MLDNEVVRYLMSEDKMGWSRPERLFFTLKIESDAHTHTSPLRISSSLLQAEETKTCQEYLK